MSENNYGAMMIKSAVGVSDDINEILSPGIYLIPPANTSSPDSGGGALIIHSGSPIRRTFTSDSVICLTSTRNGNAWTSWRGPLSRKNPFADIKADGAAAIAEALSNLGLASGAPAIGIPFFWPSAAMPNTVMTEWADMVFLKWNGATFSASTYPKLALAIPSLTLVESRGEFPRIWDDGRGVDSGRALLSAQGDAIRNMTGTISVLNDGGTASGLSAYGGVFSTTGSNLPPISAPAGSSATRPSSVKFDPSTIVPTAGENRPRNIAFNFLVRAK